MTRDASGGGGHFDMQMVRRDQIRTEPNDEVQDAAARSVDAFHPRTFSCRNASITSESVMFLGAAAAVAGWPETVAQVPFMLVEGLD